MKLRRKAIWIAFGVVMLGAVVGPELQYQRDLWKYRVGLSLNTIEREYATDLELDPTGNILPPDTTEDQKRRHPAYDARIAQECIIVTFNDYHEVLYVRKFTPVRRLTSWLRHL